jgi:hypothetical protein
VYYEFQILNSIFDTILNSKVLCVVIVSKLLISPISGGAYGQKNGSMCIELRKLTTYTINNYNI